MLWLYQRVFFGELTNEKNKGLEDVNVREILTIAPLIAMCLWIGVYPKPFFEMTAKSAEKIVATVSAPGLRHAAREAAPRLATATAPGATSTGVPAAAAAAVAVPAAVAEVK
jgi:NADH-quinone oxidoreductase subunit M